MGMVRLFLLVTALLAASCSNRSVVYYADADILESLEGIDISDVGDSRDAVEDAAEAGLDPDVPPDLTEIHDFSDVPSDLEPHECVLPIRDCGPGCRQVTCAAIILDTYAWDVSGKYISYFGLMERDVPGRGLYVKDLESGVEALVTGYPDPQYGSGEVIMEGPRIAYRLVNGGDPTYCRLSLRWIDTRSFADNVAFCYYSNPDGENFAFGSLDIFNDIVVWYGHDEGEPDGICDLFMFDLTAMQMTRLTYYDGANYNPKIWERNIAYERYTSGNFEIFLMDLDTTEMTNLTGDPSDQWDPDIRENRVVWTDHRNGMGETLVVAAIASPEFIARAVVGGLQLSSPRRLEEGDKVIAIFLLVDSMVQIAGLTLAIVGHVMYSKARKEIISQNMPPVGHSKNRLGIAAAPFVAAGGGGIALQGTF
jgi:beta propeller repeat protein